MLLVIDILVTLILYFTTKYLAPGSVDDIKIIIATLQPLFIMVVGAIGYEDGQAKRAVTYNDAPVQPAPYEEKP
jgi:hypothetical protein